MHAELVDPARAEPVDARTAAVVDAKGDLPKLPIQMNWSEAEAYGQQLGYPKVHPSSDSQWLRLDDEQCSGGDDCRDRRPSLIFEFTQIDDAAPPRCVTAIHAFPLDWKKYARELAGVDATKLPSKTKGMATTYTVTSVVGKAKLIIADEGASVSIGPGCEL
jgi:hypothetical protein